MDAAAEDRTISDGCGPQPDVGTIEEAADRGWRVRTPNRPEQISRIVMTDRNPPDDFAEQSSGSESLEEAAREGSLPETHNIDEAAEEGRDTSEADDPGDNRDTDPIAGGGILGGISQSR
jgi:hypothetical protein